MVFSLAPFGRGNPTPLFAALGVEVAGPLAVMQEKHLPVMRRQNGRTVELQAGTCVDVAFTLEEDSHAAARGLPPWGAVLRDVRPA